MGKIECYVAEFIGTYLLVLTVGCNVLSPASPWAATSIACVLMVSIYAMGPVSGANFNPAVSMCLGVSGKLPLRDMAIYCVVQIFAGICAGGSYWCLFGYAFNLQPGAGFGWWEAMMVEVLYTFMLCFVVLNVATTQKNDANQYFGLAIGFVIVAGGYAGGNVSGGCFNPAVAFGIDVPSAGTGFGWCFAYLGFEMIGAGLASLLFRLCRPEEFGGKMPEQKRVWQYSLTNKLLAEFIGTFFLVFTVGMNVLNGNKGAAFSIGGALMCMIYALGSVSGAHFNPAVTVAILLSGRGKIMPSEAAAYIGSQVVAGVFAAFTYSGIHHGRSFTLGPGKGHQWVHSCEAEVIYTFVLCYVVLAVATIHDNKAVKDMFGFIIGSCVIAGGTAVGNISGGSLNPAVSVGISSANVMNGGIFINCLAYTLFELIGAALAAGMFRVVTHKSEFKMFQSLDF